MKLFEVGTTVIVPISTNNIIKGVVADARPDDWYEPYTIRIEVGNNVFFFNYPVSKVYKEIEGE